MGSYKNFRKVISVSLEIREIRLRNGMSKSVASFLLDRCKEHTTILSTANGIVQYDLWTMTPKLVHRQYNRGRIQLAQELCRKQLKYPEPLAINSPSYHLAVNFDQEPPVKTLTVPIYPMLNDILAIKGPANQTWYSKVTATFLETNQVEVKWFNEIQPGVLRVTHQTGKVHLRTLLSIVSVRRSNQGFLIV